MPICLKRHVLYAPKLKSLEQQVVEIITPHTTRASSTNRGPITEAQVEQFYTWIFGYARRGEQLPSQQFIHAHYPSYRSIWAKLLKSGRLILYVGAKGRVAHFTQEGQQTREPYPWRPHFMLDAAGRWVRDGEEWVR